MVQPEAQQYKCVPRCPSLPGYHSHVVIYTVLGVGIGVSASSYRVTFISNSNTISLTILIRWMEHGARKGLALFFAAMTLI